MFWQKREVLRVYPSDSSENGTDFLREYLKGLPLRIKIMVLLFWKLNTFISKPNQDWIYKPIWNNVWNNIIKIKFKIHLALSLQLKNNFWF
jgi:hypothetical protein